MKEWRWKAGPQVGGFCGPPDDSGLDQGELTCRRATSGGQPPGLNRWTVRSRGEDSQVQLGFWREPWYVALFIETREPERGARVCCDSSEEGIESFPPPQPRNFFHRASHCIYDSKQRVLRNPGLCHYAVVARGTHFHGRCLFFIKEPDVPVRAPISQLKKKKILLLINVLPKAEPNLLKADFYIHLFQNDSYHHGPADDWFHPLYTNTLSFYFQRTI